MKQPDLEKLIADAVERQAAKIAETVTHRILARLEALEEDRRVQRLADDDPIDAMPLPARVSRALHAAGVETVGELDTIREEDLLRWRNFGRASLEQLKGLLAMHGRELGRPARHRRSTSSSTERRSRHARPAAPAAEEQDQERG